MMEKDEIDAKVNELARSGGNPAMRGVMFANMYIKVKAYDSAMSWLDKFLTVKGTVRKFVSVLTQFFRKRCRCLLLVWRLSIWKRKLSKSA